MSIAKLQLGKNGVSEGYIESLKNAFKTHDIAKISVLQNKEQTRKDAEEIISKLGNKYTYKIIGFTIIIKKWRKARR